MVNHSFFWLFFRTECEKDEEKSLKYLLLSEKNGNKVAKSRMLYFGFSITEDMIEAFDIMQDCLLQEEKLSVEEKTIIYHQLAYSFEYGEGGVYDIDLAVGKN